jgi:hypothetical protein
MAYFLPSLVCLVNNALKRLSEWHVEYDLGLGVRVAQVAKRRTKTVSKADVILWTFRRDGGLKLLEVRFHTIAPSYLGRTSFLSETEQT